MMRHRTLASAMLAAFGAIGGRSAPLAARPLPNDATVTSLRVVPKAGHADVLIHVDGEISLKHFTLTKPDKIVVDMSGATLGLPVGETYDGVARGGITRIRYSQFTRTVVRVVLTLDSKHPYTVVQDSGLVRISVDGADAPFDPWQVGRAVATTDAPPVPVANVTPRPAHVEAAPVERPAPAESRPTRPASETVIPVNATHGGRALAAPEFQQSQEPRITVSWENAPIADVLGMFANFTGRTILPSKNVVGNVTANIVNLPWDVALKEVMNANGYDVSVNPDGVIVVDTFASIAARQATTPLVTRTVRLNYAKALGVRDMVLARLTRTCRTNVGPIPSLPAGTQPPGTASGTDQLPTIQDVTCPQRGTVTADTVTNSISITDVPSAIPSLLDYVKTVDLRQPQVNIRAKIILVDRSSIEGLGLRYDLGSQTQFFNDLVPRLDSTGQPRTDAGQIALGGNTLSAIANATLRVPGAALQLVYSTAMGDFDFTTFLEALQTNTLLDVQAEPSATVMNNYTANLTAGTQVPIRIIDAGASSAGAQTTSFPRATVSFQQTGIILIVTPQITANRQIQMKVHVENSDVQFEANDVGAVFPKQSVDNVVLVGDGETAVMGGLTQQTLNTSRSGLPILSELPIIGRLFGVTNRTEEKRDLLILLTPHIIDPTDEDSSSTGRP